MTNDAATVRPAALATARTICAPTMPVAALTAPTADVASVELTLLAGGRLPCGVATYAVRTI